MRRVAHFLMLVPVRGSFSLAASRVGASPVHAVDIDPMSVRVAQGNLDHNEATALIPSTVGSADWAAGQDL